MSFDERKGLKAVVHMPETVKAPIAAGQEVGTLVVSVPGQLFPIHGKKACSLIKSKSMRVAILIKP